jgi:hypothetical protein
MTKAAKEAKKSEVETQLDEFLAEFKKLAMHKFNGAISVAPEEFLAVGKDNYLLAKSLIDSVCQDRPCRALAWKKEFENIHTCS